MDHATTGRFSRNYSRRTYSSEREPRHKPSLSKKSILRHSISEMESGSRRPSPEMSLADSFNKSVRFSDRALKRKVSPSPELLQLVRSDSESSLTSGSSGPAASEVSESSGVGSMQEILPADYSFRRGDQAVRVRRQYSSNDSDYSTETESIINLPSPPNSYSQNEIISSSAFEFNPRDNILSSSSEECSTLANWRNVQVDEDNMSMITETDEDLSRYGNLFHKASKSLSDYIEFRTKK